MGNQKLQLTKKEIRAIMAALYIVRMLPLDRGTIRTLEELIDKLKPFDGDSEEKK